MREVDLIVAPWTAGRAGMGTGRGPARLLEAGLDLALEKAGCDARVTRLEPLEAAEAEIALTFEAMRRVSTAVAGAIRRDRFPIVLAGDGSVAVGVHAGIGDRRCGVAWFGARPDFDTPDEALCGRIDRMATAILTGQSWRLLAASVPGFVPLDEERLLFCGIRDFAPGQREKIARSAVRVVYGSGIATVDYVRQLDRALEGWHVHGILLQVGLDCLDPGVGLANADAAPGGLGEADLLVCLARLARRIPPAALVLSGFDPAMRGAGAIATAAIRAAVTVVRHLPDQPIAASSASRSGGLTRWSSNPAARERSRSSGWP